MQPGDVLMQVVPPPHVWCDERCHQPPSVLRVGANDQAAPGVVLFEDSRARAAELRRRLDAPEGVLLLAWPPPGTWPFFPREGLA
jgi:hypothetical protein